MGEKLVADLIDDLLAGRLQKDILDTVADKQQEQHAHILCRRPEDACEPFLYHFARRVVPCDKIVDGITDQNRFVQFQNRNDDDKEKTKCHSSPVGLHIGHHPDDCVSFIVQVVLFISFRLKQFHLPPPH